MIKRCFLSFILILALALSGCGLSGETADTGAALLKVDTYSVSYTKALLLIIGQRNLVESTYGVSIWDAQIDDGDMSEYLLDTMKGRIGLCFAGACLARESGVSLTDDEQALVDSAAEYLYAKMSAALRSSLSVDVKMLTELYTDYRLACRGYEEILSGTDIEISRDEARVIVLGKALVLEDGTYDEAGQFVSNVKRGELDASQEEIAFALHTGQISEPFTEGGISYAFKCINSYEETLSAANREELTREAMQDCYVQALKSFVETHPVVWNDKLWESIDMNSLNYSESTDFYDVYEMFFGEL